MPGVGLVLMAAWRRFVRQIFPVPGRQLSQAGPLEDRIRPTAVGQPGVADLVDALAGIYAFPDGLWVRANMLASVDGAIAVDGRSGGLSGPADRLVFSVLRSLADVILVGAGTARAERYRQAQPDDSWPQLRAGRPATPPIAVVTRRLDLDLAGRLFASSELARTIVLTTGQAPGQRRMTAERVADVVVAGEQDVSAAAAIDALAERGHRRILVEGGPILLGQLTAASLLDELCLTISPVLEGGHSAGRATAGQAEAGQAQAAPGPTQLTGLTLATLLEDDGFLLSRYVRAR